MKLRIASVLKRTSVAAFVVAMGGVGSFAACTTPATEIVSGTTTQIQVPKDLASVGIVVRYGGQLVTCQNYPLSDGTVALPSTLGLVPAEGREEGVLEPVTVTVIGFRNAEDGVEFDGNCFEATPGGDDPKVVVLRSKRMPYLPERIVFLPMPLKESCTGVACPENETCVGGLCEDNLVDADTAVDYKDSLIFGDTNTCFNPDICLPDVLTIPAVVKDYDTCEFRYTLPPDSPEIDVQPGFMNVEIVYASFGTEILDLDDKEGFVIPDPDDPLTFRLASNLCESNYKTGKILSVRAAPTCAAKRALQPICSDAQADINSGLRSPPQDFDGEALCNVGNPLVASESALYVLVDRSASMSDLYGPDGVEFAVSVPLRNPISARTSLALSYIPAANGDCTDSSYDTPDFGFDDVENVRGPIAESLAADGTLLSDDPELFLDAAMNGAYEVLGTLTPTVSKKFNRRAVVIVGNRDLQAHCAADVDPATLAANAKADGFFTYVAVLDAPPGAEQFGDDPQASGAAIAEAGGTEVFDDVAQEGDGAIAVQRVLNDLGSCVYDEPDAIVNLATHLSYLNPVNFERTDIERNDACNSEDAATTVDGWGIETDGGGVRICGAPCEALRVTLTDVATAFAALREPAPQVPIVASIPCADPARFQLPE